MRRRVAVGHSNLLISQGDIYMSLLQGGGGGGQGRGGGALRKSKKEAGHRPASLSLIEIT